MVAKVIRHPRTGQPIEVEAQEVPGPRYADGRRVRDGFAGSRYAEDEYEYEDEDGYEDEYVDEATRPRTAREGRQNRRARRAAAADAVRNNMRSRKARPQAARGQPRENNRQGRGARGRRGYAGETRQGTTVVCEAPEKAKFPWGTVALTAVVMTAVGWGVKGALDRVSKAASEGKSEDGTQTNPAVSAAPQQQLHPVQQLLLTSPGAGRLMPAYTQHSGAAPPQQIAMVALPEAQAPKARRTKKNPEPEEDSEEELLSFMDRYIRDMDEEDDEE